MLLPFSKHFWIINFVQRLLWIRTEAASRIPFLSSLRSLSQLFKKTQKVETTFKYFLLNHACMFSRQGKFHYTFSNGLEDLHVRENSVIKTDMLCLKIRTVFSFNLKNSPQNGEETIDVSELFLKHTLSFSSVKTTSIKTGG